MSICCGWNSSWLLNLNFEATQTTCDPSHRDARTSGAARRQHSIAQAVPSQWAVTSSCVRTVYHLCLNVQNFLFSITISQTTYKLSQRLTFNAVLNNKDRVLCRYLTPLLNYNIEIYEHLPNSPSSMATEKIPKSDHPSRLTSVPRSAVLRFFSFSENVRTSKMLLAILIWLEILIYFGSCPCGLHTIE